MAGMLYYNRSGTRTSLILLGFLSTLDRGERGVEQKGRVSKEAITQRPFVINHLFYLNYITFWTAIPWGNKSGDVLRIFYVSWKKLFLVMMIKF